MIVENDQFWFAIRDADGGAVSALNARGFNYDNSQLSFAEDVIAFDGLRSFGGNDHNHHHCGCEHCAGGTHADDHGEPVQPVEGGYDAKGASGGASGVGGAAGSGGVGAGGVTGGAAGGGGSTGAGGATTAGGALGPNAPVTPNPGGALTFGNYTTSASAYNITIEFKGGFTQELHDTFVNAADRLAKMIVGDVADARVSINGAVVRVDDIYITAQLTDIDGAGGVLGRAGPTAVRGASFLPVTGTMQFDTADAQTYLARGLFDEVVTHEMLHTLGFGSLWSFVGLTDSSGYVGARALAEYNRLLAEVGLRPEGYIPLEDGGGAGTAGAHWSESVFADELMTGFINPGMDPLSRMTLASLQDLGYRVNYNGPIDGYAFG